jgi:hypothetical protein
VHNLFDEETKNVSLGNVNQLTKRNMAK